MATANALLNLLSNTTFVTIDRAAALQQWHTMVGGVNSDESSAAGRFWAANREVLLKQKATYGILGHSARKSRSWRMHVAKERLLRKRLADNRNFATLWRNYEEG